MLGVEQAPTRILVVEDNSTDVILLRFALSQTSDWATEIEVAEDGEEALQLLLSLEHRPPDLMLLDLNLPRKEGTEVLRAVRAADHLQGLPVIVFSSSPEDVLQSKVVEANLTAEGYVTKPLGIDGYLKLPELFREFLRSLVRQAAQSTTAAGRKA